MTIFDSSVWVAFFNDKDSQYKKAREAVTLAGGFTVIPEHIVAETASVLLARANKEYAEAFLEAITGNPSVKILLSEESLFWNTLTLFREKENKKLSFVDVSLLFLSSRYEVVSFDQELSKAIKKRKNV
jgi:predicted nucleic acid-binding protein